MQKRDLLKICAHNWTINIQSTDPDEVVLLGEILKNRFPGKDRVKFSPDGYCLTFYGVGVTHDLLDSATQKKPYITDVQYSLINDAKNRNWEPFDGIEIFIRNSVSEEINKN